MGPKTPVPEGDFSRQALRGQINLQHPLVRLADLIGWQRLNVAMSASVAPRPTGNVAAFDRRTAVLAARIRPVG